MRYVTKSIDAAEAAQEWFYCHCDNVRVEIDGDRYVISGPGDWQLDAELQEHMKLYENERSKK